MIPKMNQIFKSKSKIQNDFVEYIYKGEIVRGEHLLISTDDEILVVDTKWFDNRTIKEIEN